MNQRIYKYMLEITGQQEIVMPRNVRALSVGVQQGDLCLWALVDIDLPSVPTKFRIVCTGHPFDDAKGTCRFVGTVQIGRFVWHVFHDVGGY